MFGKTEKQEKKPEEKEIQKVETKPSNALSSFDEMDQLFDQFMSNRWMRPFSWRWPEFREFATKSELRMPNIDVVEKGDKLIVKAEVPGVDKKDIDISLSENSITIKGKTSKETKEEEGDFHRQEISTSSFSRTISLPSDVEVEQAKAKITNGVVEVTMPKQENKKRHTVKVE